MCYHLYMFMYLNILKCSAYFLLAPNCINLPTRQKKGHKYVRSRDSDHEVVMDMLLFFRVCVCVWL